MITEIYRLFSSSNMGGPLIYLRSPQCSMTAPRNQKGALGNNNSLHKFLSKEFEQKSIIGPFECSKLKNTRLSPIDAIPKKDSADMRVILNLSYPTKKGQAH